MTPEEQDEPATLRSFDVHATFIADGGGPHDQSRETLHLKVHARSAEEALRTVKDSLGVRRS